MKPIHTAVLLATILALGPPALAQSDYVMYGVSDDTHALVRYGMSDGQVSQVGAIHHYGTGATLSGIDALAHIPGLTNIFGFWTDADGYSRLVYIDPTAKGTPLGVDLGTGKVKGAVAVQPTAPADPGAGDKTSAEETRKYELFVVQTSAFSKVGTFGVLGLENTNMITEGSLTVKGNYGIGPAGKTTFSDGASGIITDNLQYDPTAAYTGVTNMTVGGEVEDIDLTMAAIQARELSYRASQMTPTLVAGAITGTTVLNSTQPVNVVSVTDIHMDGQRTLTLNGGPTDSFIVNVSGGITLEGGSKILLSGGLDPSRVLFNVLGAAGVNFTGNSNAASGLILAPSSNILIKGSAQITGGVIGGGSYVKVGGQPTITQVPYYAGWSTMGGETSRLLKVDHRTGSVKLVMMLDREYDSLASPFSAGFYASSAGRLYLLDPSTGNEDLLAAAQDFQGLEFAGPRLYGFAAGTDRLTRIDAVTGSTGSAIDVAATDLRGIVFIRVEDDPKPKTGYD